jgi:hypothetical protein
MTDNSYCDESRGEQLIAYLYDDQSPSERVDIESHLAACAACREELGAMRGLRRGLARWSLPEPSVGFTPGVAPAPARAAFWAHLTAVPVWAQAAAAVLVLGVAAGFANLDIRYDDRGVTVRTGWSRSGSQAAAAPAPWQTDLQSLADQLRGELRESRAAEAETRLVPVDAVNAARVQSLIAESERRQERELALRLAELSRDMQVQRRGDLEKIQYSLGLMESNMGAVQDLGIEVMRQRQIINGLAVPASGR